MSEFICIFGFLSTNTLYIFLNTLDIYNIKYREHTFMNGSKYFKVDVYVKNKAELKIIYDNIPPEYLEF